MAASKSSIKDMPVDDEVEFEDRIDEFAIQQFEVLGYTGRLPDVLVKTYDTFKQKKDMMTPGRLTPGEFVTVIFLAGLLNKR